MNTRKVKLRLGAVVLAATTVSVLSFAGCSGDDATDMTPTNLLDSGPDVAKVDSGKPPVKDGGGGSDSRAGKDAGDATNEVDAADAAKDATPLDTGTCKSEASTCNSCYSDAQAAQDPYNACSSYTKNCVKFTTAVPAHPTL